MIATQTDTCIHCGEPTAGAGQPNFCCHGCRVAYEMIHGWGLEDYYALRDQQVRGSARITPQRPTRYEAFDNDAFLGRSAPVSTADGLMSAEFAVEGLHCAACAWLIENVSKRTIGWTAARVKLVDHTIRVLFDPGLVRLSQIARVMGNLGYEISPLTSVPGESSQRENRRLWIQMAVAGFCAANAMWISIALYAGEASGVAASHRDFLRLVGTGLAWIAVAYPGRTFFQGALASLKTRTPHMDLPVALGLLVGTMVGTVNVLFGAGSVYFDSLAVLVFLLLVGRWIQFRQQHRAADSIDLLMRVTPRHANLKTGDGQYELVLAETVSPGAVVRVAAGESIAADGVVGFGDTLIDRSLLTGESEPVPVGVGGEVCAGAINLSQPIEIRVSAVGEASRVGRVMKSVEEAMATKTPIVQLADRVGGFFVVVVTLLAGVTFAFWLDHGFSLAASHATSLLIVACPCALALATPLAIAVSLGRAAKRKILIRDGSTFQRFAKPGRIWFDKTGTLTQGKVTMEYVAGRSDAIEMAAAIEKECNHPIADAIVALAKNDAIPPATRDLVFAFGGVSGIVGRHAVAVGNLAFMKSQSVSIDEPLLSAIAKVSAVNWSPIMIAVDGQCVTVLRFSDGLKVGAAETVATLQRQGWTVGILSGDVAGSVARVAKQLGIKVADAVGDLAPEQKLERVRQESSQTVVMVGDGANDAAALAAADVGIAVRGGAEVSLQAAPVFISSGDLSDIVKLHAASRRTMWLIATAFAVSLGYNVIAVGLAMTGVITPLIAALLMPVSSLSVLSMTLMWPTFGRDTS